MAQQPIEMILARQFADHVATPMVVIDAEGTAVFWNEPAERFTGLRFDETGRLPKETWVRGYKARDRDGNDLPSSMIPTVVALEERRPAHLAHQARLFGGEWFDVDVSALPVVGQQDRFLGVVVLFWSDRW
jgi:PAS domain S-box-containing protein